ncbi:MAG: trehalase family glycosidase [Terriglobia bacterium]
MNHRGHSSGGICIFYGLCLSLLVPCSLPAQTTNSVELAQLIKQYKYKESTVRPPQGLLKYEYLVPGGKYSRLFDWDMNFIGVALSYDGKGMELAHSVQDFLLFTDVSDARRGWTPREITPEAPEALPQMCKPFLAQAALRATRTMGNINWLRDHYGALASPLQFWETARRANDGLFRWFNGGESGVDNNPAVSSYPTDVTEGVDLQCYLYREYVAMAILSRKLGHTTQGGEFQQQADDLKRLIQQKMWSEADGIFLNIDSRTGQFVRIKSWTNFVPLWAGVATREQAQRMIRQHLLNPGEFWAPSGIRTLAADEPLYDPQSGYWRGPVWVVSNYLLMHGLMNYGFQREAREIAAKTVSLLLRDLLVHGCMSENYQPETGEPARCERLVGWNLLAEHMQEEAQTGSDPTNLTDWMLPGEATPGRK